LFRLVQCHCLPQTADRGIMSVRVLAFIALSTRIYSGPLGSVLYKYEIIFCVCY